MTIRHARTAALGLLLATVSGAAVAQDAKPAVSADLILQQCACLYRRQQRLGRGGGDQGRPHPRGRHQRRDGQARRRGHAHDRSARQAADAGVRRCARATDLRRHGLCRCSLHAGKTLEDYRRIIAECVAKTLGIGTIFGSGWNQTLFPPKGIPDKGLLDSVSKDRALIFEADGHTLWVNSKALELAKITRDTPAPKNGTIDRDGKGEPVGGLEEWAIALVEHLVPPPTPEDRQGAITYAVKLFNSMGITSWHDAALEWDKGSTSKAIDAYKAVSDSGRLTMHTVMDLRWNNDRGLEQLPEILKLSAHAKQIGLTANGVKFFIDGVIPQQTAAMLAPYEGTDVKGATQIALAPLAEAVTKLDALNMQSHFYAIGDADVRQALDAVEAARKQDGVRDTRPIMSHMNVIDPADQPRFGKLGVTAIFQPLWACDEPYMRPAMERIRPVRSRYIYPAGSIQKAGGRLAYGADWSVASANPFEGLEVAVTRIGQDSKLAALNAAEGARWSKRSAPTRSTWPT